MHQRRKPPVVRMKGTKLLSLQSTTTPLPVNLYLEAVVN
jgi:hypothetical protein